ncbi:Transcription termination factor like [Quillaja saponaria]|uniref:Transcription termination factor like n=1 Tax=Quillaja saponaria TaxID=32244 RepID=A0AAD7VLD6_QUISA|nr:Transcription termination factor like [Quillaja saponaria]
MFDSYRKTFHRLQRCISITVRTSPTHQRNLSTLFVKYSTSTPNSRSFTMSYLIKNCGLSPETALSASKYLHFKTPEKPDLVLSFLRSYGFSNSQIARTIKSNPRLLQANPVKTYLPKMEFLQSIGASSSDLVDIITSNPNFLKRSLKNNLIPSYDLFKSLLQSDKRIFTSMKRTTLSYNYRCMTRNIKLLRDNGVPDSSISTLLLNQPSLFSSGWDCFKRTVDEVKKMGFSPSKLTFVSAVHIKMSMSKSTWQRKVDVFKRWGWSEGVTLAAFGRRPWCMGMSEDKIMAVMDIFVNQLGLDSMVLAKQPFILLLSLKKRIIPRVAVLQFLLSRGLVNKNASLIVPFAYTETSFLQKFVKRFKEEAPELLTIYKEKINSFQMPNLAECGTHNLS